MLCYLPVVLFIILYDNNICLKHKHSFTATDSLDVSVASLQLMSTLTGKDLWSYCQSMPHLFSVGGLFYRQVERDLGLADGKHCKLPSFPGKVQLTLKACTVA